MTFGFSCAAVIGLLAGHIPFHDNIWPLRDRLYYLAGSFIIGGILGTILATVGGS